MFARRYQHRYSMNNLLAIKIVHTIVWAFFVGCIVAIPAYAWVGSYAMAWTMIGIVMLEVMILVVNGWQCPLTRLAARHTDNRRANFDIFLPVWLAHYNKLIFGTLYVLGIAVTVARWRGWIP